MIEFVDLVEKNKFVSDYFVSILNNFFEKKNENWRERFQILAG